MFQDLYFGLDSRFRDHNFSSFLGHLRQVSDPQLSEALRQSWSPWRDSTCTFDPNWFANLFEFTLSSESCKSFFRRYGDLPVTERDYYLSKLAQFLWHTVFTWFEHVTCVLSGGETELREHLQAGLDAIPNHRLEGISAFKFFAFHFELGSGNAKQPMETVKALLQNLTRFLPTIADDQSPAGTTDDSRVLSKQRTFFLEQFRKQTGRPAASIYQSLGIDKSDFYRWKRGTLPNNSTITIRIKNYIRSVEPTTTDT